MGVPNFATNCRCSFWWLVLTHLRRDRIDVFFVADILICITSNQIAFISIWISLKFISNGPLKNISVLVHLKVSLFWKLVLSDSWIVSLTKRKTRSRSLTLFIVTSQYAFRPNDMNPPTPTLTPTPYNMVTQFVRDIIHWWHSARCIIPTNVAQITSIINKVMKENYLSTSIRFPCSSRRRHSPKCIIYIYIYRIVQNLSKGVNLLTEIS